MEIWEEGNREYGLGKQEYWKLGIREKANYLFLFSFFPFSLYPQPVFHIPRIPESLCVHPLPHLEETGEELKINEISSFIYRYIGVINLSDIKDYTTLYSAYSRLKTEGDKTASAKNAQAIFGHNVDIDGDNTAELWEFMQKANELNNRIIFKEISSLKRNQDKYSNIADSNPIRVILAIENGINGDAKIDAAYTAIDRMMKTVKEKLLPDEAKLKQKDSLDQNIRRLFPKDAEHLIQMGLFEELSELQRIFLDDYKISYGKQILLSDAFNKPEIKVDCDTGSYLYIAAGYELNWPLYLVHLVGNDGDHAFIAWPAAKGEFFYFETTSTNQDREKNYYFKEGGYRGGWIKTGYNELFSCNYDMRGNEYYRHGNYTNALEDALKSVELDPRDESYYYSLGMAYSALNDQVNAVKYFTTALDIDDKFTDAYYSRGIACARVKIYDLALKDLNKAIELDPKFAMAYKSRSMVYESLNESDLAKKDMEMYRKLTADRSSTNK